MPVPIHSGSGDGWTSSNARGPDTTAYCSYARLQIPPAAEPQNPEGHRETSGSEWQQAESYPTFPGYCGCCQWIWIPGPAPLDNSFCSAEWAMRGKPVQVPDDGCCRLTKLESQSL